MARLTGRGWERFAELVPADVAEPVLDDFRAAEGERHDEDALRLALLGGLVRLGWDKALHASGHPDPAVRAREAADLAWWTDRARAALQVWSPS